MTEKAFRFIGCIEVKELLGYRASDEQRMMEFIEEVPLESIYFHTHSFFLRHPFIAGAYPNDFASWAVIQVRDRVLGEKLAGITLSGTKDLEEIRSELVEIIDLHLAAIKIVPHVVYGQPFYFMKSRIIEIPTGQEANDLKEFVRVLETSDTSIIYNHIFGARFRTRYGRSDFSAWISDVLERKDIAERIDKIDSYMYSLEGLREKVVAICQTEVGGE